MATTYNDVQAFTQDADLILRMFSDQAYFEQKYAQTASACEIVECEKTDSRFRIKAKLKMPTEAPVPGFAKKFIADSMTVIQQDTWDLNSRKGKLEIEIVGAPISVSADMELVSTDKGCENRMRWTFTCKVPLVGGKVEQMIQNDVCAKAPRDLEVSRKIAATYG